MGIHVGRFREGVAGGNLSPPVLLEQFLQHRSAPTTTCPRPAALVYLACETRIFDSDEIPDLPQGDMKAEAEFVILLHFRDSPSSG